MQKIVASGEWLYDGSASMPVHVVKQDYDFWYEIGKADDQLEPDETPQLNAEGVAYYILYGNKGERPWWVDSHGFETVEAAREWAEAELPSPVRWQRGAV